MTALATSRNTVRSGDAGTRVNLGCAANTTYYTGALICKNASGYGVPGLTATTLVSVGRYDGPTFTSSGTAAVESIDAEGGVYRYANSASTDTIAIADIGSICYVVDDQTVAKTSGTNTRSVAGVVVGVDSSGVLVQIDILGRKA